MAINPEDYCFLRFAPPPTPGHTGPGRLTLGSLFGLLWSDPVLVLRILRGWDWWEHGRRQRATHGTEVPFSATRQVGGWVGAEEAALEARDRKEAEEAQKKEEAARV